MKTSLKHKENHDKIVQINFRYVIAFANKYFITSAFYRSGQQRIE